MCTFGVLGLSCEAPGGSKGRGVLWRRGPGEGGPGEHPNLGPTHNNTQTHTADTAHTTTPQQNHNTTHTHSWPESNWPGLSRPKKKWTPETGPSRIGLNRIGLNRIGLSQIGLSRPLAQVENPDCQSRASSRGVLETVPFLGLFFFGGGWEVGGGAIKGLWGRRGSHTTARELQTCTFERPGVSKTPPKFHEKTPRERKRAKMGRERGKKARNFGPPAFGPPPFELPRCIARNFGPHPSDPNPWGPNFF